MNQRSRLCRIIIYYYIIIYYIVQTRLLRGRMNGKKKLAATFISNEDPSCWTEVPHLTQNKSKCKSWLLEESVREHNNERLELQSFSSFSFTTINSNNEQLSKEPYNDYFSSEDGSIQTFTRNSNNNSSFFNPTIFRHQFVPSTRLNSCAISRISSRLNTAQCPNLPSTNQCCSSLNENTPSTSTKKDTDSCSTKPPSIFTGSPLPDDGSAHRDDFNAEETSCSNTTVESDSASVISSDSHLVMDILSTSSCSRSGIHHSSCPTIHSNKSTLRAHIAGNSSGSSLLSPDVYSSKFCSYNTRVDCDISTSSHSREQLNYDELLLQQSRDDESETAHSLTCLEPNIHYLPKHWRSSDCATSSTYTRAEMQEDDGSTNSPCYIGTGFYCYERSNSTLAKTKKNTLSDNKAPPVTANTNLVVATTTQQPSSSDLRKVRGGTRRRIQQERRRPLRFCSVSTPLKEVTNTSIDQPIPADIGCNKENEGKENHLRFGKTLSLCEPMVHPEKNSSSSDDGIVLDCKTAEEVCHSSKKTPLGGPVVCSEKTIAKCNEGVELASSKTNKRSEDGSYSYCSLRDSVNTGTTEDTNYDNASSSTIQTANFDDFLEMFHWDGQANPRRKKLQWTILFLLIVAAAVVTIFVPIYWTKRQTSLPAAAKNLTSTHAAINSSFDDADDNRSINVTSLEPLTIRNSTKPTSEEEEYYDSLLSTLANSNCAGYELLMHHRISLLERSTSLLYHPKFRGVISNDGRRMALSSRSHLSDGSVDRLATKSTTSSDASGYILMYEASPNNHNNDTGNTTWDLIAELDLVAPCEECEPYVFLNEDGSLCAVASTGTSTSSEMELTMYKLEMPLSYRSYSPPTSNSGTLIRKRRHYSNQTPSQRSIRSEERMNEWSRLGKPLTLIKMPSQDHPKVSLSSAGYRLAVVGALGSQPLDRSSSSVIVFDYNSTTDSWEHQSVVEEGEVESAELSADGDVLALLMLDTSNSNSSTGADSLNGGSTEQVVQFYNWKSFTRNWELVGSEMATKNATTDPNRTNYHSVCASFNESILFLKSSDANSNTTTASVAYLKL